MRKVHRQCQQSVMAVRGPRRTSRSRPVGLRSVRGRTPARRHPVRGPARAVLEHGHAEGRTAPAPARAACSATRCATTCRAGFPLVTTKRVHFRSIAYELLWFLRGDSNVGWLHEHGVTIWDEWAGPDGELGPVYGVQWRSWPTPGRRPRRPDRAACWTTLRSDPDSRRHDRLGLERRATSRRWRCAPCHALFQFYVADGRLSCQLYQRSADLFLGVPFNIASYALLTHMVAQQVGLERRRLRVDRRRLPHLRQPRRRRCASSSPASRCPFPTLELRTAAVAVRLHLRGLRGASATSTTRPSGRRWRCDASALDLGPGPNGVIGADGALPWHLPEDLAPFRELTMGSTRRHGPRAPGSRCPTRFRPLPGRHNVVLTRQPGWSAPRARDGAGLGGRGARPRGPRRAG